MESPTRNKKVLGLDHRDNDDEEEEDDEHEAYMDEVEDIDGYAAEELQFSSGD